MVETLKIEITPKGIKVDASGFIGGKCIKTQEDLEKFLAMHGIMTKSKDQKRKLEQMYASAPGETIMR